MNLYSAWYCPFAQRAWIALLYKNINFNYIEIDPYHKTQEWLELSKGTGQVPVLIHPQNTLEDQSIKTPITEDKTIVDSNRIIEYLDRIDRAGADLFSVNESEQIEQKIWIGYINKKIIPYFYRFLKADAKSTFYDESKESLLEGIMTLTCAMKNSGAYFNGEKLSAVDIAFIPFAYRIKLLLKHYKQFELPTSSEVWKRYHQWYSAVVKLSEFKQTSLMLTDYDNRLTDFYLPYSKGGGQSDVTVI